MKLGENTDTNLNSQNSQNPSRRDFLKKAGKISAITALALAGISPTNLQAKENKTKPNGQPPKLNTQELEAIAKESKLSVEKIQAIKAIIDKMMDHNKFSDNHRNSKYKPQNDGYAKLLSDGETLISTRGVDLVINKKQRSEVSRLSGGSSSDSAPFYSKLEGKFHGKELKDVKKAYKKFMRQIDEAQSMINSRIFFNHEKGEVPNDRKVETAYNRIIAVGMVEGWSAQEFQVALEVIFPRKLQAQGLEWDPSKPFPGKLLQEDSNGVDHLIFYDPKTKKGQQGNISKVSKYIRSTIFHEKGYSGGETPLERATKLYKDKPLKQAIYTLNIITASQFRYTQDQLENKDTTALDSKGSQYFSGGIKGIFSPQPKN
jgi:hypothetical protein